MAESVKSYPNYDAYVDDLFAVEDDALRLARETMANEGLPAINVSPSEGKLLNVLVYIHQARRILEIGTLGGYSAIWMARALPQDGKLISLELDVHHAEVAWQNVQRAGLDHKVEIRVGAAATSLDTLAAEKPEPFDIVFIDADKDGYVEYLAKSLPLLRKGGLVLGDNTLPEAVLSADATSGTKRYNAAVAQNPELVSIVAPMLRGDHMDGLTISVKTS